MAWEGFIYHPYLNMSTQKDITGDTRFVQDSEVISSGIGELRLLKSHWLVSAVINYERQTGWCSQMKQNMFGCAAQPSNDAGKQKDNCPLRWLGKSFWRNVTRRRRDCIAITEQHKKIHQQTQACMFACAHRPACTVYSNGDRQTVHFLIHTQTSACRHTCEVSVDRKGVTGKLVVTVSWESGSSDNRILWVR